MTSVSNPEINFAIFSFVFRCKGVLMSEVNVSVIKAISKFNNQKIKKTKNSSVNLVTYLSINFDKIIWINKSPNI